MTSFDLKRLQRLSGLIKEGYDDWRTPPDDSDEGPGGTCPMCSAKPGERCNCDGSDDKQSEQPMKEADSECLVCGGTPEQCADSGCFGDMHPHNETPEDFESCSDCGFDHEYEPEAANSWHKSHGAPNLGITPGMDDSEKERRLRGESSNPRSMTLGELRKIIQETIREHG